MSKKIEVLSREARLTGVNDQDYVCLTDIARYKNSDHTDGFNPIEFDGIRMQAGFNSFVAAAYARPSCHKGRRGK